MKCKILDIYSVIEHLEKRRAMLLGNGSNFQSLSAFISGFTISNSALELCGNGYNSFSKFNTWLLGHLPEHFGSSGGWHWQISNLHKGDEEAMFAAFYEFVRTFRSAEKAQTTIEIEPKEQRSHFATNNDAIFIVDRLVKVQLSYSSTIWTELYSGNHLVSESWFKNEAEYKERLFSEYGVKPKNWGSQISESFVAPNSTVYSSF